MRLRHVDFAVAAQIFDGNVLEIADDRQDYGEDRILAFGEFEELSYLVVYTWRDTRRRIITAWRLGEDGRRRYQAIHARRSQKDA